MKKSKMRMLTCLVVCVLCMSSVPVSAFAGSKSETTGAEMEDGKPLSEESSIVTRDLLYDEATNKQFITITDRDGNTFYLVIDYDAPVSEDEEQYKTYFLNPVDIDDLTALTENGEMETPVACSCTERCQPGAVFMNCELCSKDMTGCVGKEPEPEIIEAPTEPETEASAEEPSALNPAVTLFLLILLGGGGAFAYFKLGRNRPKTKGNTDLDDYDYGDEDSPWENEDAVTEEPDDEKEASSHD